MSDLSYLDELMARVQTAPTEKAGKILLIYSCSGTGKTSTFCQAQKTVLVECKDYSSDALKESGAIRKDLPVIKTTGWDDALGVLGSLAKGGHDFMNVVIDGGTGLHEWSDALTIANECEGSREKFSAFGRGDQISGFYWQSLMETLDDLRRAGIWVFFLCHKGTVTERNPSGSDYIKSVPALSKQKLAQSLKYCDAILYMDFVTEQIDVNKQSKVGKAVGGEVRVLYCKPSAGFEAKNRLGLESPIYLGSSPQEAFRAFREAVKQGRRQAQ